ncbi:nitroreductase family protein [Mycolicibacterium fluoranthenivorans]|uniref:Nitroreductase family protein n=1 Tax=Mycolicibacterium fluoranthenivorans TaxID=258505 RepID=A0A7G8PDZ2_9MYCO|nr:nitroreductase family protein [Mycolicibacterium fluoranthenivorans]QNJ92558.1 nitroreductase family protein [Mycolicibacterium fluoranthenivorans]
MTQHALTVIRAIMSRRSVRSGYDGLPLPMGCVEKILACGLAAPSSKNSRPWRLHAVLDKVLLEQIAELVIHSDDAESYVPCDPVTGLPDARYSSSVVASGNLLRSASIGIFVENIGPYSRGRETVLNVDEDVRLLALHNNSLEMIGIGAAFENMWLAAVSLGYSATLMVDVAVAEKKIAPMLGIRGDLVGVLAIGNSSEYGIGPASHACELTPEQVVIHHAVALFDS